MEIKKPKFTIEEETKMKVQPLDIPSDSVFELRKLGKKLKIFTGKDVKELRTNTPDDWWENGRLLYKYGF